MATQRRVRTVQESSFIASALDVIQDDGSVGTAIEVALGHSHSTFIDQDIAIA